MSRTYLSQSAVAGVLLATLATPSHSAIFDRDDRRYALPSKGSPYSAIGLVKRDGLIFNFTTGFLVDDCHVLTSHAVLGYGQAPLKKRLTFHVGIGTRDQQSTKATVVAAGAHKRRETFEERYETSPRGWLLLRLDKCLGSTFGHVKLKTGPFSPFEFKNLQSAGYPVGRSRKRGLTVDPACSVYFGRGPIWFNDCALVKADGGGPIFRISAEKSRPQLEVYAIQLYGLTDKRTTVWIPGRENQAVAMSQLAPLIKPYLSSR